MEKSTRGLTIRTVALTRQLAPRHRLRHCITMATPLPLLVFTDLDGTSIDHHSYDWAPATPALQAIKDAGGGIILASSKTAPEIEMLRTALNLDDWPAIVENGAGLLTPKSNNTTNNDDYIKIRAVLDQIPASLRQHFAGFGDLTPAEVAETTGLPKKDAELAKLRSFSEPGIWSGTDADRATFEAALKPHGITAREGGRFLTLSFGCQKSDQMAAIIDQYQPKTTIALGDAPNDVEMLEAAQFGVIVANPARAALPKLKGEDKGQMIRTTQPGPTGWNDAILTLLARLDLQRT